MKHDNWISEIKDPSEVKVFEALANPKWDFRTVKGIAKETSLNSTLVSNIINAHTGKLIRKSVIPDKTGDELYTLKSKRADIAEIYDQFRTFLSKNI
jgi:hypothetical protein